MVVGRICQKSDIWDVRELQTLQLQSSLWQSMKSLSPSPNLMCIQTIATRQSSWPRQHLSRFPLTPAVGKRSTDPGEISVHCISFYNWKYSLKPGTNRLSWWTCISPWQASLQNERCTADQWLWLSMLVMGGFQSKLCQCLHCCNLRFHQGM